MTEIGEKPKRRQRASAFVLALSLLALSGIGGVWAKENGGNFYLDSRFFVAVGGFFASVDTEIKFDPDDPGAGSGTRLDVEDILGLDETDETLWLKARWRFAQRHSLELEGFHLTRGGNRSFQRTTTIGDVTANVGASSDSDFNLTIGRLTYGWTFIKDERKEAVLLAGAHVARAQFEIALSGNIEDASTGASLSGTIVEEGEDITVPLPHFGGRFAYAFSPRLVMDAGALAFYIKIGDITGSLIELHADIQYLLWENVALGTGLRLFNVRVKDERNNGSDEYEYLHWGPVLFLSASF